MANSGCHCGSRRAGRRMGWSADRAGGRDRLRRTELYRLHAVPPRQECGSSWQDAHERTDTPPDRPARRLARRTSRSRSFAAQDAESDVPVRILGDCGDPLRAAGLATQCRPPRLTPLAADAGLADSILRPLAGGRSGSRNRLLCAPAANNRLQGMRGLACSRAQESLARRPLTAGLQPPVVHRWCMPRNLFIFSLQRRVVLPRFRRPFHYSRAIDSPRTHGVASACTPKRHNNRLPAGPTGV